MNKKQGYGETKYPNQDVYKGQLPIFYWLEGYFNDDVPHGNGILMQKGKIIFGTWINGELVNCKD